MQAQTQVLEQVRQRIHDTAAIPAEIAKGLTDQISGVLEQQQSGR